MLQTGSQQNPRATAGRTTETSPDPRIVAQLREPHRLRAASHRQKKKKRNTPTSPRKRNREEDLPYRQHPQAAQSKGKTHSPPDPDSIMLQGWAHPGTSPPKPEQPHGSPIPAPSPLPDPAREHAARPYAVPRRHVRFSRRRATFTHQQPITGRAAPPGHALLR